MAIAAPDQRTCRWQSPSRTVAILDKVRRMVPLCPNQIELSIRRVKFQENDKEKKEAAPGGLSIANELHCNDSYPAVRAWNLSVEKIMRDGALFNMYRGALFSRIDVPMVLLLWPGYGVSRCGFHYGCMLPGSQAATHSHQVSDECIVN